MANDLMQLPDEQIRGACARLRRESRSSPNGFAPKLVLGDIVAAAGIILGSEAETVEAVAAWDLALRLADTFGRPIGDGYELRRLVGPPAPECERCAGAGMAIVQWEGRNFAKDCTCKAITSVPEFSDRLGDTVARLGGWGRLRSIPPDYFALRRKDFIAEYVRWVKVEKHLNSGNRKRSGLTKISSDDLISLRE